MITFADMSHFSKKLIRSLFSKFSTLKVFVVGDAMLDNYWYGDIERISPEAPVPVVNIRKKESRLGGAANVALNLRALGCDAYLLCVVGKDESGKRLREILNDGQINTDFCLHDNEVMTTTKTRVIAKNQQTIRIDEEIIQPLTIKAEHHFIDTCLRAIQIEKPDLLIFEDYNKGLLSENMIEKIITHCKHVGVTTAVDPKFDHFFAYKNVDLFKPNLKEIKDAFKIDLPNPNLNTLKKLHKQLHERLQHDTSIITLSERGVFVQQGDTANIIPAHVRQIADVSGAGDTVIAVASLVYHLTHDVVLSAEIANIAGGIVCEQAGVVSIAKQQLLTEVLAKLKLA